MKNRRKAPVTEVAGPQRQRSCWYVARVLQRSDIPSAEADTPLYDDGRFLVRALSHEHAQEKAETVLRERIEQNYLNSDGEQVFWRFDKLLEVSHTGLEQIRSGTEIYSRVTVGVPLTQHVGEVTLCVRPDFEDYWVTAKLLLASEDTAGCREERYVMARMQELPQLLKKLREPHVITAIDRCDTERKQYRMHLVAVIGLFETIERRVHDLMEVYCESLWDLYS